MEKTRKSKSKNNTSKPKKKKTEGPTCSMFLADLRKRFQAKKRQDEEKAESRNIVKLIIESISNALPVKFSRSSPPLKKGSPMKMETLQSYAPELQLNDARVIDIPNCVKTNLKSKNIAPLEQYQDVEMTVVSAEVDNSQKLGSFKVPRMPLMSSDIFKKTTEKTPPLNTEDASVNTSYGCDVAGEIAKHVTTLKKISLIAEEFNQKTAKNLKEIVDSVQADLLKKLEECKREENALKLNDTNAKSLQNVTIAEEK